MENQKISIPIWFWIIAVVALLWNLMGVMSFYMHVFITDEALQALPEAERNLYDSYPLWTEIAFGIAVLGGFLGSIALLMKKKWAKSAFLISLLAIIPQMTHNLFFTNVKEVYGPGTEIMPVMVIIFGVFLLWFSSFGIKKGWLK